jgi:26S proteasome regulatory subunit T2
LTASGKPRDPRRPHLPAKTPFAKSQPDEKYIDEQIEFSSMRHEDPRVALLKYATDAERKAWEESAANSEDVSDEEEPERKKAKVG